MSRVSHVRRDDQGFVLMLALAFITFVGVIALALVRYTTTNLRATIELRQVRAQQFAADGAVDGAINAVRNNGTLATPATQHRCFTTILNQQHVRVDCTSALPDVTFTACPDGPDACTATSAVLVADATINGAGTGNSWSLRR